MDALKRVAKLIVIITLFIVGLYALFAIIEHIDKNKFNKEFNELLSQREKLILKIKNNEIEFDDYNFVKLPEEYKQVATNGRVRVLRNTEEETLIGFLYKSGFPDEEQYIYYSNKDTEFIKEELGENNVYDIEKIIVNWYFVQYN